MRAANSLPVIGALILSACSPRPEGLGSTQQAIGGGSSIDGTWLMHLAGDTPSGTSVPFDIVLGLAGRGDGSVLGYVVGHASYIVAGAIDESNVVALTLTPRSFGDPTSPLLPAQAIPLTNGGFSLDGNTLSFPSMGIEFTRVNGASTPQGPLSVSHWVITDDLTKHDSRAGRVTAAADPFDTAGFVAGGIAAFDHPTAWLPSGLGDFIMQAWNIDPSNPTSYAVQGETNSMGSQSFQGLELDGTLSGTSSMTGASSWESCSTGPLIVGIACGAPGTGTFGGTIEGFTDTDDVQAVLGLVAGFADAVETGASIAPFFSASYVNDGVTASGVAAMLAGAVSGHAALSTTVTYVSQVVTASALAPTWTSDAGLDTGPRVEWEVALRDAGTPFARLTGNGLAANCSAGSYFHRIVKEGGQWVFAGNGVATAPAAPACSGGPVVTAPPAEACETDSDCASPDACHIATCRRHAGWHECVVVDTSACAVPYCALPGGCAFSDTDGDGLSDTWERNQYVDVNCNGRNDGPGVDLQLPGADPNVPDIYVRYDWMELPSTGEACAADADCQGLSPAATHIDENCVSGVCTGHTHDPEALAPGSLALVTSAFAKRGFNLHIVRGVARPHSRVVSFKQPVASCEGADVAPGVVGQYAVFLDDSKFAAPFNANSEYAFHYAVFGHYSSCDSDEHCQACDALTNADGSYKTSQPVFGQTGIAEIQGNDFMVSLGRLQNDFGFTPNTFQTGGTFMHELGHNLGLHHGGANEDTNFKPNYISVMNYLYQSIGIRQADTIGSDTPDPALTRLDYSTQVLPTGGNTPGALIETGLSEPAGLGSGTADLFNYTDGPCQYRTAASDGPVDWDGDGVATNVNASVDLNPSDHPMSPCGSIRNELLNGHIDWGPAPGQSSFTYSFQCTPFFADDETSHALPGAGELTCDEIVQHQAHR